MKMRVFIILFLALFLMPSICYAGTSIFSQILGAIIGSGSSCTDASVRCAPFWCIGCPLYQEFFKGISAFATTMGDPDLREMYLSLLGLGFLFFLAFRGLKVFSLYREVSFSDVASDLLKHFFKALIAVGLLFMLKEFFTLFVNPIINISLSLSQLYQDIGGLEYSVVVKTANGNQTLACQNVTCGLDPNYLLSEKTCQNLTRLICSFNASILVYMLLSIALILASFYPSSGGSFMEHIYGILIGLLLLSGFFSIFLQTILKFIDILFRLGFVCLLIPFYLVLWVFPSTVKYTKKGWDMFLQSCLSFLTLSIFILLVIKLLSFTFGSGNVREIVISKLLSDDFDGVLDLLSLTGTAFLITLGLIFVGYKFINLGDSLASSLGGKVPALGLIASAFMASKFIWNKTKGASSATGWLASKTVGAIGEIGGKGKGIQAQKSFQKGINTLAKSKIVRFIPVVSPLVNSLRKGSLSAMKHPRII